MWAPTLLAPSTLSHLHLLQQHEEAHARRLLLSDAPSYSLPHSSTTSADDSLNANVVMVLAVLVCSVVCVLAVNAIVRCALVVLKWARSRPCAPLECWERDGGGREEALTALSSFVYHPGMGVPKAGPECAICLWEFVPGERVRLLPMCNHGFHVGCVDRWLASRPSCPTCRRSLPSYVGAVGVHS
ncbi:RING-H2 finger protein ATL78-like [Musa acuminata AAA Group]|uniref:RING-H2 finger protein ATL78-like n=1 Tax=Musa acuminata AAA Group TaxID=214697 RepID=UPI0031DA9740